MLQKFNERIQGVFAWVVIGVIALTFTLFGVDSYLQAHRVSAVEAEVDGHAISKQAFELQYRRMRQAQAASGMTDGGEQALKRQILDDMIATQVNTSAARKAGFGLDAAQAQRAIFQIPEFQKDGQFSPDRYQQALTNALFTPQGFQEEVRQGMLLNQQRFAFMGTAFALPDEVEKFVKLYGQTRDYKYLRIPSSTFLNGVTVSDAEIKAYYDQQPDAFFAPEAVSLEFVKVAMPTIREGLNPTEAELKSYYESNQNNYMAPTKWYVQHVLFKFEADATKADEDAVLAHANAFYESLQANPKAFEQRMKAIALEKPNATQTGVLPWIEAGSSDLDASLIHLTKAGELLGPVKTPAGYEVFQLLAYEPTKLKPYDAVKAQVKNHWLALHTQTEYARLVDALTDQSYQTPDTLVEVAESLKLPLEQTERLTRDGGKTPLAHAPDVIKAAFSHDVLTLGNNSAPIQLDEETVIVLRVKSHFKAKRKPLRAVSAEIKQHLMGVKAQEKAKHLGEGLLYSRKKSPLDVSWQTVTQATRDSSLAPADINHLAFTLSDAKRRAGFVLEDDAGYVVVELTQIIDGKLERLDAEQRASVAQQISAHYGAIDYDLYVNNLLEKAKVERH